MSTKNSQIDNEILSMLNSIKSDLTFKLLDDSYEQRLQIFNVDKKCITIISNELLEDFEAALKNLNTPYFHTIKNKLKWKIAIELAKNNIYPSLPVSSEMINEQGDWLDPRTERNIYDVIFDQKMTQNFADGLQYLINSLEAIINISQPIPLRDIEKHKDNLNHLYEYYLEDKSFDDRGVSVFSLQYLKAAAIGKIIELEERKSQDPITRIIQAVDEEIYFIVDVLCQEMFYRIKPPEFLISIKELSSPLLSGKTDTSSITINALSQVDHYDVAFSLAHEQHDYVDKVFKEIRRKEPSLKVFYYRDEAQEIKLWGRNMMPLLQKIYRDQSDHIIIFVSNEYVTKRWARHEWRSVQEAILDRKEEYLLPARFDAAELEGLYTTINYIDLSKKTPEDFAKMIIDKVKLLKS